MVWKNKATFGFVLAPLRVSSAMVGGTLVLLLLPLFDLNMTFKLICMFRSICTPFYIWYQSLFVASVMLLFWNYRSNVVLFCSI